MSLIKTLNDLDEDRYITIFCSKFISKSGGVITFELLIDFSFFNILDEKYEEENINKKIALKFQIIDYNQKKQNTIEQFRIESPDKNIITINPNKDIIYYIYEVDVDETLYFSSKNIDL